MFEMKYRILVKCGGAIVADEKTDSLRTMNDVARAYLDEGGNEVIVFEDGKPYNLSNEPSSLGADADGIIGDYFAFDAAVRRDDANYWSETPSDPDHPGYRP